MTQPETSASSAPTRESIETKLKRALEQLLTVTVATLVSDVKVSVGPLGQIQRQDPSSEPIPAIITNMNLITGDVTMELAPSLKDDANLLSFHQGVVNNAVRVLPDNLKELVNLVDSVFK
jgi:hypothetical protein